MSERQGEMTDYISREKDKYIKLSQALEILDSCSCWWAHDRMKAIPAADVRPVALCRDCKHNKGAKVWRLLDDVTADCSAGHGYPPMDWFCADGEKREES